MRRGLGDGGLGRGKVSRETNGCAAWVVALVFDVVGRDFGGFGVEERQEGFGKGQFGRHFCGGCAVSLWLAERFAEKKVAVTTARTW